MSKPPVVRRFRRISPVCLRVHVPRVRPKKPVAGQRRDITREVRLAQHRRRRAADPAPTGLPPNQPPSRRTKAVRDGLPCPAGLPLRNSAFGRWRRHSPRTRPAPCRNSPVEQLIFPLAGGKLGRRDRSNGRSGRRTMVDGANPFGKYGTHRLATPWQRSGMMARDMPRPPGCPSHARPRSLSRGPVASSSSSMSRTLCSQRVILVPDVDAGPPIAAHIRRDGSEIPARRTPATDAAS